MLINNSCGIVLTGISTLVVVKLKPVYGLLSWLVLALQLNGYDFYQSLHQLWYLYNPFCVQNSR